MRGLSKMRVLWPLLAALGGCSQWPSFSRPESPPPASTAQRPDAPYLSQGVVKTEPGEDGAVGAALAWSQRHAKLSEELLRVQQAKHELEEVNRKLAAQVAGLQGESQSAQKELAEAHQMLLEMRRDLDQWKSNVLGFREEIRQAQQAQADALRKVLVLLGAEVPASAATQPATQPAFSTAQRSVSGDTANHK